MNGERWRTSTTEVQETLLKVCESVQRMPGKVRKLGAATLQSVRNVKHTTHNALHTTHDTLHNTQYTLHTTHYTLAERYVAWASILVYVYSSKDEYADHGGDVMADDNVM